jgi:uncharacterized lipoprotein YajG
MQIQVQDMYLHVNQDQTEYNGFCRIVAFWSVFFVSTSLINKDLESKINKIGLKSDMQIQVQDMYLHVNQGQTEYNGFGWLVAFWFFFRLYKFD